MNTVTRLLMLMTMFAVAEKTIQPVMANETAPQAQAAVGKGVEKRVERQNNRIERKLENKKITEAQAEQLKKDVQAVDVKKDEMLKANNGKPLNKEQRKELHGDLKKNSEQIKAAGSPATTKN